MLGGAGLSCTSSFLFLADGERNPNAFQPNKDETQWTGRRDALVRISAAALWGGVAANVTECAFLLTDDHSLLSMGPSVTRRFTRITLVSTPVSTRGVAQRVATLQMLEMTAGGQRSPATVKTICRK